MDLFTNVAPIVAGAYLLFVSFILNTKNFMSSLLFKFVPFVLGASSVFAGFKLLGIL